MLGSLFGTTNTQNIRTELIVFITPRVIRNPEDARRQRGAPLTPAIAAPGRLGVVVTGPYVPPPGQRPPVTQPQVLVPLRPRRALKAWRPSRALSGRRRWAT